jgi:alkylation response protein AidB-like acyl-CoA dehydrogenase
LLREVVRKFLADKSSESAVRAQMITEVGYDRLVWQQMAEQLGLQALTVPEEFGGQGYGWRELAIVLEEMGRVLLCSPYFSTVVLAATALLASADVAVQADVLSGIAAGELICTLALPDPAESPGAVAVQARAAVDGERWRIGGRSSFVLDGHVADVVLVVARTSAGLGLFRVAGDATGLTRTLLRTLDETRKQSRLDFDDVPATLVGRDGDGLRIMSEVLDRAAVGLAAEQLGGAQAALEMAVRYAKQRVQFGQPIGSFQAIKHKCADLLVEVESARAAVAAAVDCAAGHPDELPAMASLAKAYCSEAYFNVAAENIHIHGGIGFTWEHPAHLYFKRAKTSEVLFGGPTYHRELLAQRLGI